MAYRRTIRKKKEKSLRKGVFMKNKFGFLAGICSLVIAVLSVVMLFTAIYFFPDAHSGEYSLQLCVTGMGALISGHAAESGSFENVLVAFSWVEFLIGVALVVVNLVAISKDKCSLVVVGLTVVGAGLTSLCYLISGIVSVIVGASGLGTMAPLPFALIWLMMVPAILFAVLDFVNKMKAKKVAKAEAQTVAEVA